VLAVRHVSKRTRHRNVLLAANTAVASIGRKCSVLHSNKLLHTIQHVQHVALVLWYAKYQSSSVLVALHMAIAVSYAADTELNS
jgi:hypothetical protein